MISEDKLRQKIKSFEKTSGRKISDFNFGKLLSIIKEFSEKRKIIRINFLDTGKKGIVFLLKSKNKSFVLKFRKTNNFGGLIKEGKFLKLLEKSIFVPHVYSYDKDHVIMDFVKGKRFPNFVASEKNDVIEKTWIIWELIDEMAKLDSFGIDKEEMNHPKKHIIISKNLKPYLIDFERSTYSQKPKNETQFISYLCSKNISALLSDANIEIKKEFLFKKVKDYKTTSSRKLKQKIISEIKSSIWLASPNTFRQKVYDYVKKIPEGKVSTYKSVALHSGANAPRTVGTLMNKNVFAPIVPCHRVIALTGNIGGFASGIKNKIQLLEKEGVYINNNSIDLKKYLYDSH